MSVAKRLDTEDIVFLIVFWGASLTGLIAWILHLNPLLAFASIVGAMLAASLTSTRFFSENQSREVQAGTRLESQAKTGLLDREITYQLSLEKGEYSQ